jgi:hypothetical protein
MRFELLLGCHLSVGVVSREYSVWHAVVVVVRMLAFVIVRRILSLVGLGSNPDAKDVEIAVLRHQLTRQVTFPDACGTCGASSTNGILAQYCWYSSTASSTGKCRNSTNARNPSSSVWHTSAAATRPARS